MTPCIPVEASNVSHAEQLLVRRRSSHRIPQSSSPPEFTTWTTRPLPPPLYFGTRSYRKAGSGGITSEQEMPTVFRSMRMAADGFPVAGRSTSGLGVRVLGMVPPAQKLDVDVDVNEDVICNDKGMSVNDAWRNILPNFLPMRCGGFASNNRFCFKMG